MQLKIIIVFIITIFLTTTPLLYSDSTNTVIDSINAVIDTSHSNSVTKIGEGRDNIYVGENTFKMPILFKSKESISNCNYLPLIATFLGSFFAALIAIFSVNRTHKKNREIEEQRINDAKITQEANYNGLLYGIYSELKANDEIVVVIKGEIQTYLKTVKNQDKLIATDVFHLLKTNFIKECRLLIIRNKSFSPEVLRYVSKYIYKALEINRSLESEIILQIPNHLKPGESLYKAVSDYFNKILKVIIEMEKGCIGLKQLILSDHQRFPNIDLQFTDSSLQESYNVENDEIQ